MPEHKTKNLAGGTGPTQPPKVAPKPAPKPANKAKATAAPAKLAPTVAKPAPQPVAVAPPSRPTHAGMKVEDREVMYPDPVSALCIGTNAMTVAQAMDLLEWEEVTAESGRDAVALFKDQNGKMVACWNIHHNRPFDEETALGYAYDMLNRRWKFNFENIIIGRTGLVISGQHRLVGLVFAEQLRTGKDKHLWETLWPEEVKIETSIGFGADESSETTSTMDNVRARTQADTVYSNEALFAGYGPADRRKLTKILGSAINTLWDHAGATEDKHNRKRTLGAANQFFGKHPRLEEAVKRIYEEDKVSGRITYFCKASMASAMLYLMGAMGTDYNEYHYLDGGGYCEDKIDWSMWDTAVKFWTELGRAVKFKKPEGGGNVAMQGEGPMKELFRARRPRIGNKKPAEDKPANSEDDGFIFGKDSGDDREKWAAITYSWFQFMSGNAVRARDVVLEYSREYAPTEEGGEERLADAPLKDFPILTYTDEQGVPRGIDTIDDDEGKPNTAAGASASSGKGTGTNDDTEDQPTPEEVEQAKEVERKKKESNDRKKQEKETAATTLPAPTPSNTLSSDMMGELALLKAEYPGCAILVKTKGDTVYQAWGSDAEIMITLLSAAKQPGLQKFKHQDGIQRLRFHQSFLDMYRKVLVDAKGKSLALVEVDGPRKEVKVIAPQASAPEANGAPATKKAPPKPAPKK